MDFYPEDKFPHLGPLPWPHFSRLTAQPRTQPGPRHTRLSAEACSPTQLPSLQASRLEESGFELGEALPQKAGDRGQWLLTLLQSVPGPRKQQGADGIHIPGRV